MEGEYAKLNVTDWSQCPCPVPPQDKLSTGKGRQRLPHFDDVGGEHLPRLSALFRRIEPSRHLWQSISVFGEHLIKVFARITCFWRLFDWQDRWL
jgi:hypothetical protein